MTTSHPAGLAQAAHDFRHPGGRICRSAEALCEPAHMRRSCKIPRVGGTFLPFKTLPPPRTTLAPPTAAIALSILSTCFSISARRLWRWVEECLMPLYWLCYRYNNQISVVIEPGNCKARERNWRK